MIELQLLTRVRNVTEMWSAVIVFSVVSISADETPISVGTFQFLDMWVGSNFLAHLPSKLVRVARHVLRVELFQFSRLLLRALLMYPCVKSKTKFKFLEFQCNCFF